MEKQNAIRQLGKDRTSWTSLVVGVRRIQISAQRARIGLSLAFDQ